MIPVPSGVRVWLAVGRTDMRRGMNTLALQVQETLGRDPHAGDLYVFRGARGDLVAQHLTDLSGELASVGDREAVFPLPHGRGDQVRHGGSGPDPRALSPKGLRTRDIYIPDLRLGSGIIPGKPTEGIKVKPRNFR
jgi:transposase